MTKQVIVVRKDLHCRKGKMCAQVAHASLKVLFDQATFDGNTMCIPMADATKEWFKSGFTKVVAGVADEQELFDIHQAAQHAGLPCSLIQDAGRTEFKEPTYTAVAVGPAGDRKVDEITGHLKLL